jgi:HEAT repeat protein
MSDEEMEKLKQSLHESKQALATIFTRALADPDADVREEAGAALVRLGSASVPRLLEALRSEHEEVRSGAAEALGKLEGLRGWTASVIAELLQVVTDPSEWVRSAAIVALGRQAAAGRVAAPQELLLALNRATEDPAPMVRRQAIWAISHILGEASRLLGDD